MNFRANPKDNCFPGMSLLTEQQNTASAALKSITRNFSDEYSPVVERFPVQTILKKLLNESGEIASRPVMLSTVTGSHICLL